MSDLEEQISQITNPQEFVKLCNTVFSAEYGEDYQVVDGTRGDEGNDGYVYSKQQLLAIYCPIKPESRTDRHFVAKIKSDMRKAAELHVSGRFQIQSWAFVTPRKLSTKVLAAMNAEASSLPFSACHLEATFLSNLLYKHALLIQKFPFLHVGQLERKIDSLLEKMAAKSAVDDADATPTEEFVAQQDGTGPPSEDLQNVLDIRGREQTEASKAELRTIYYASTDRVAQLNAVLGLLQWHDPVEETESQMIEWCDQGIAIASELGAIEAEAFLLAKKGVFLSSAWVHLDISTWVLVMQTNLTGVPLITEAQRCDRQKQLKELDRAFTESFDQALERCGEASTVKAWAEVLICIGNAAGQRAAHIRRMGLQYDADGRLAKRALLAAKDLYAQQGNDLGAAYAVHNLANQLSYLGESQESLALTRQVLEVARKHGDFRLEQTARWLEEALETGRTPDYLHGERRERKK